MRILIDNNLPALLAVRLREQSHDSVHLKELRYQRAPDTTVWEYAKDQDYAILTKDYDFCRMSDFYGHPPKVIWLGIGNNVRDRTVEIVLGCIPQIEEFIALPTKSLLVLS